ncbi:sigma-70 family RNA polymerase sigma factor [Phenylobacterium sp. J426]|uniref:ECF-type sigma factor n=1 Tax=Phenylobacterium sp. J426 TaxID=2898439 RepID=UPI002150C07C|nr:ECF-type sigma factor [Phenylobacterium sp. J426]MCR5876764.1 sigma-70 family RNA polymerase sigma factor [Phenylobacterium sp. J426]
MTAGATNRIEDGVVRSGADRLASELWSELRKIALRERFRVNAGETLRATVLISEAWLKLRRRGEWRNDDHFLHSAALAMRHVLVDHARARLAAKRGAGKVDALTDDIEPFWESDDRLVELDEALTRLGRLNPRLAQVVELRFFAGYSDEQTAALLGVTDRTVRRDWVKARAWLYRELNGDLTASLPPSEARIAI